MAVTHNQAQVLWATANTKSVAGAGSETSDAFTPNATAVSLTLTVKADGVASPHSSDILTVSILFCNGDTDATGGDEWDTVEHASIVFKLDTNAETDPQKTIEIPAAIKSFKIHAANGSTQSNAITVSARVGDIRA